MKFDTTAYLSRLGIDAPIEPNEAGLNALHRAQAYTIPFENLDILLGRGVDLQSQALFDKLVTRQRGGYCFELNEFFLNALQTFGFDARRILARIHLMDEPTARTHEAILVRVDGREWLADVGGGAKSLRAPIPFVLQTPMEQDGISYRLVEAKPFGTMLQIQEGGQWQDICSFDLDEHVSHADVEMGNYFTSRGLTSSGIWHRNHLCCASRRAKARLSNRVPPILGPR